MVGFHQLIFVDFSCDKFSAISWSHCEKHPIQAANEIHNYSCPSCQRSFPVDSALELHRMQSHSSPSKHVCCDCNHDCRSKTRLDYHRQIQPSTSRKHLTDVKRDYIASLSLTPRCALENNCETKHLPEINYKYYDHLKSISTLTSDEYESLPVCTEGDDSDSSQS